MAARPDTYDGLVTSQVVLPSPVMKLPVVAVVPAGAAPLAPGVTACLPTTTPPAVTCPADPSNATALSPVPALTLPNLPLTVTGISPVAAPLVKVVTPSAPKATLPVPAVLVIDVISVRSPFTFTLYGLAVVPSPSTVVFIPASNFVLATDTL